MSDTGSAAAATTRPNPRKVREGLVVSTKMDKTAVVRVERTFIHPLFKKTVRRSKRMV